MENIQQILIVRYGEIALKGMNRPYFEKALMKRLRAVLSAGEALIEIEDGLVIARRYEKDSEFAIAKKLLRVFGVASVSPAWELQSREQADIGKAAVLWMSARLEGMEEDSTPARPMTFKVFGKRADKSWPVTSPELAAKAGEAILEALGEDRVKVDVSDPRERLYIHLRRKNVLIYSDKLKGFGGLPLGTNGKGLVLLSGGIDSPVAAWMMAKRGMTIEAVHFHSYPYTSKRAEEKTTDIADILAGYCGRVRLHILNILPAQEAIAEACPEEEMTILTRRFMMRIATHIAEREGCGFLITGENLGQVASQTAEGIAVTDRASPIPILRPLIALDKVDIMERAQEIGTYGISIRPYEDCCTVFLPTHPVTKPALKDIEASEALIGQARAAALLEEIIGSKEIYIARP